MADRDTASLPTDPPILVGGGGSTWVWIHKDYPPQQKDSGDLGSLPDPPDPDTRPKTPGDYYLWHIPNFTVNKVHVHDGQAGKPDTMIPNNPNARKKHRTYFD